MSFNPDDNDSVESDRAMAVLQEENNNLKKQIEEFTRKLAQYEIQEGARTSTINGPATNSVGRRSIPFHQRNIKQYQGRMKYLLTKLETNQQWNQDTIADLQEYCTNFNIQGAGQDFLRTAIVAYGGESSLAVITDIDIDLFISMLQ
jgi:hypothetical protein